jgi:hypothetical protein
MTLGILDGINYGYRQLEPVIVGLMAMHKSFMLIGRHGTGKTRLARALSAGYGSHGFVFYDATKDDLVSIAGIPDPESLRAGRLRFVGHERSIWDKSTIVVDEITRAGKESQNLQLTRGTVATMAQIGDPAFVPRLVELAVGDDESHKDAAVRGLERVAERFAALGLIVLDIRDPYRLATRYGISDQIDHAADRHSEALRLLMLALDRKRSADRAVAENGRKVMLTPLSAEVETVPTEGGWDQATFEQLALYLSVTFVDEDSGTVIAEITTEPTGEVLSALLQTRTVCATTVAWS